MSDTPLNIDRPGCPKCNGAVNATKYPHQNIYLVNCPACDFSRAIDAQDLSELETKWAAICWAVKREASGVEDGELTPEMKAAADEAIADIEGFERVKRPWWRGWTWWRVALYTVLVANSATACVVNWCDPKPATAMAWWSGVLLVSIACLPFVVADAIVGKGGATP